MPNWNRARGWIRLRSESKAPPREFEELGGTGSEVFDGRLDEADINAKLSGATRYATYDTMRIDPTVSAGLRAMKLPLLAAEWPVSPADPDDERSVELAEFVENDLQHMSQTWQVFLRHVLLMFDYGSSPFEIVWLEPSKSEDGKIHLRKLAIRLPKTITEWLVDDHGGFNGVIQNAAIGGDFKEVEIPPEKMLVFVNELEGSDFRGISLLRAALKPWTMKDGLERVDAIAKEKRSNGTLVGTMSATAEADDKEAAERAMMSDREHQRRYLLEVEGKVEYRLMGIEGAVLDTLASVKHHELAILRAMLAEFLAMGNAEGARAVHEDKTSMFMLALGEAARNVEDTINRHLIPKMIRINFPDVKDDELPTIQHTPLDTRDVKAWAESLVSLITAGAVTVGEDDEDIIRTMFNLPDRPEDEEDPENPLVPDDDRDPFPDVNDAIEEMEKNGSINKARGRGDPNARRCAECGHSFKWGGSSHRWQGRRALCERCARATAASESFKELETKRRLGRSLRPHEKHVNIIALQDSLDGAQVKIVDQVRRVQRKQIDRLVELGRKVFTDGKSDNVERVEVPFRREISDGMVRILEELVLTGRNEVLNELEAQGATNVKLAEVPFDPQSPADVGRFLRIRSRSLSNLMADRLRSAFVFEMLAQIRRGLFDEGKLRSRMTDLSDRAIKTAAATSISEALNLGREASRRVNMGQIDRVIYSSVLDTNTCGPCATIDGQTFAPGDPAIDEVRPPYKECEGGQLCRCILVYVTKAEVPAAR